MRFLNKRVVFCHTEFKKEMIENDVPIHDIER